MKLARILTQRTIRLVLTTVFLGTASLAQSTNSSAPLRFTVPPAVATPIRLKTLPNAVCTLHLEGSRDAAHSLKLYADAQGMIHFHAQPDVESDIHTFLVIECSADGEVSTHRVELRAASAPTPEIPAPPIAPKAVGTIRPALTTDQVNSMSDEELIMAHYPPKPDPKGAPAAYAAWFAAVSHPTTLVAPHTVHRSDIVAGPLATLQSSVHPNWSGFAAIPFFTAPNFIATRYKAVTGLWQVPWVTAEPNGRCMDMTEMTLGECTKSALWIGLDGVAKSNLSNDEVVQVGTDQDVVEQYKPDGSLMAVASYFVWTEWFPAPRTEYRNSMDWMLNPGDVVYAEVWVEPSHYYCFGPVSPYNWSCSLKVLYPTLGHFFFENLTTGKTLPLDPAPVPKDRTFSGTSAEWIMERVGGPVNSDGSCCAFYYDLANYNSALMWGAAYQLTDGQWVTYDRDVIVQFTMTDSGKLLSSAERVPIIDPSSKAAAQSWIKFTWHDFK